MYLMGKNVEDTASGTSTKDLVLGVFGKAAKAPASVTGSVRGAMKPKAKPGPMSTGSVRPAAKPAAAKPAKPAASENVPEYVPQRGVDSDADPSTVLSDPIVPRF